MNDTVTPTDAALALARSCLDADEVAFLDSSSGGADSLSIVASQAAGVIEGRDWATLEAAVESRRSKGSTGAAIGWVSFDGDFRFAFFEKIERIAASSPVRSFARRVAVPFEPEMEEVDFQSMVLKAKEYIAAGDIYQVCLSHRFRADVPLEAAWPFYEQLRACSPAPYGAFLRGGGMAVASASPECFLRMEDRHVVTRPIKGTRPRHGEPMRDESSAAELLASEKEIAELVMITDLERNDLGQICEFGSVHVSELLRLERYRQVFHLVSTVEGTLRRDVSHVQALRACFPGGSISGAPKKRALEIVAELEPVPRGIYTGAIGYFGFDGRSEFSIAIRTAVFKNGVAHFHAGAGIVADSDPAMEWNETLDKASGLLIAGGRKPLSSPR